MPVVYVLNFSDDPYISISFSCARWLTDYFSRHEIRNISFFDWAPNAENRFQIASKATKKSNF